MLFHSLEYMFLLVAIVISFYKIPHQYRWILLLGGSYFFYAIWQLEYLLLLWTSTLIDYISAIRMEDGDIQNRKKWLIFSVVANLSILAYFKYRIFFAQNFGFLDPADPSTINIIENFILPIGLSFYTFQSMGYTIDVYRKDRDAERHLGYFALYVAYFPQLIAGPIEHSTTLLPQLRREQYFNWDQIRLGGLLFLKGLFKKLVIAGALSSTVSMLYTSPENFSSAEALFGVFLSMFFLYMDFSAYTDLARGSAQMMGIKLKENFYRSFLALSFREFWKRWHISLTQWIFEYFYIPLARVHESMLWKYVSTILVLMAIGFWHGASWNFIIFGFIHGLLIVIELILIRYKLQLPKGIVFDFFRWFRTITILALTTVFFFSGDLESSYKIYDKIFDIFTSDFEFEISKMTLLAILFSLILVLISGRGLDQKVIRLPLLLRWSIYLIIIFTIIGFAKDFGDGYVYFQF